MILSQSLGVRSFPGGFFRTLCSRNSACEVKNNESYTMGFLNDRLLRTIPVLALDSVAIA